tara:strand:+ start:45 stop:881 length:837 start_codon:yes stop_codon:yes gene_type:complete
MKLYTINTGFFKLDGGAMFGVVPKSIWNKTNPADKNNMCSWAMRCLLIEDSEKLILIDTGIGKKQSEKFFNYFYLHGEDDLKKSIHNAGFSCKDITDVIFTHLHFDHCGGAVKKENNDYKLLFSNANHWTHKEHWEWANNPNSRERASFLKENFLPIQKAGKLNFINENNFIPNIKLKLYYGHTYAQTIPFINFNGKTIVFCADLLPSTGHIPLPYVMGYDIKPLITLQEKESFLNEACEKEYILFLEHDYFNECCLIEKEKNKFKVKKAGKLIDFIQ